MDRLETLVEAIAARAQDAARRLEDLTRRLDDTAAQPPDPADPVRLAAIELAVSGCDREQTAARLRERFPGADLAPALADVFG